MPRVKHSRMIFYATLWPVGVEGRAAQRYRSLVRQVASELQQNQSATADALGLDRKKGQPIVGRILRGEEASVGLTLIERAIGALRLSCAYFFAPGRELNYRDYLSPQLGSGAHVPLALVQFLESDARKRLTAEQVETLQSIRFVDMEPTYDAYEVIAGGLKLCKPASPRVVPIRR